MTTTWKHKNTLLMIIGALALGACSVDEAQKAADKAITKVENTVDPKSEEVTEIGDGEGDTTLLALKSTEEFNDSDDKNNFKSAVLPAPECNTALESVRLQRLVASIPMPTFDGVSPWPGIFGYWVHPKAGVYARIDGAYRSIEAADKEKVLVVRLKLYDLCTNKVIGEGSSSIPVVNLPTNSVRIRLEKHTLKSSVHPVITIKRVKDPKADKASVYEVGFTVQFKSKSGANPNLIKKEAILMRNVLQL